MKDKVLLYIAEHNKTGLKYFGKTTRYFTEKDLQENYHGSGLYWCKHLNKHGNDVTMFIYQICSLDKTAEDYVEPIAIKFSEENNIVNSEKWANLKYENGLDGSPIGVQFSEEHKRNISEAKKGNLNMLGKQHSQETKEKMSNAHKGKTFSDDSKRKMSEAKKGNTNASGYKHTKEARLKMSESQKGSNNNIYGKCHSQETKEKMSNAHKGKTFSDDSKRKMSEAKRNKKQKIVKCPYCENSGGISNMKRHHFENCKYK